MLVSALKKSKKQLMEVIFTFYTCIVALLSYPYTKFYAANVKKK